MGKLGIHIYTPANQPGHGVAYYKALHLKLSTYYASAVSGSRWNTKIQAVDRDSVILVSMIHIHKESIQLNFPCTIGVISDTHLNGKSIQLNPNIIQILRVADVQTILHLGDIADFKIISELNKIAKVFVVRGNRDFALWNQLPFATELNFDGIKIGMTHGHGQLFEYLIEKIHYTAFGFRFNRYRRLLDSLFPEARVRLFGHTHSAFNNWIDGVLYFNPGAACAKSPHDPHPSIGILRLENHEDIQAEVVLL